MGVLARIYPWAAIDGAWSLGLVIYGIAKIRHGPALPIASTGPCQTLRERLGKEHYAKPFALREPTPQISGSLAWD